MFNLLQNTIIFDGFISALSFFKSYISFKLNTPLEFKNNNNNNNNNKDNNNEQDNNKKDIIYTKIIEKSIIYNLPVVERYAYYAISSFCYISTYNLCYLIIGENFLNNNNLQTALSIGFCYPFIQNMIFNKKMVDKFVYRRNLFFKYTFARTLLNYIGDLNPKITGIKNYHTFILSRYVKIDVIISTIKTFLFISLLYLLRENNNTYYYYKAIKLSYFYNKGYLFNVINQDNAVNIVNKLIKDKKWEEISNEENSHAFYYLIVENMSNNVKINKTFLYILFIFFSSLWSVFCFVNLLSLHQISLIIYLLLCVTGTIFEIFTMKFAKKVLLSGIFCFMLSYIYVNELLVTILYFLIIYNKIPRYIIEQIVFFLKNYKDIEKVIEFYNKK